MKVNAEVDTLLNKIIKDLEDVKAKKVPRAPKSVTERAGGNCAQLLGPSWAALGTLLGRPGRAPGLLKRSQEHQISSPKLFFAHFLHLFSISLLASIFGALSFATIGTETLKISVSPRRERDFCKIDFFV